MVGLHLKYIDLSLSRIKEFLSKIDNPHNKIKNIIHIAGTNGKGSTTAFLRYILQEHGYSVNAFTSPHLVNYNERFCLNGNIIENNQLQQEIAELKTIEGFDSLSMFEATMAIGYSLFAKYQADYTILETGLGGRLDATNIIKNPILNIFTSISYDHENFLGNSLDKIAYEKFGILKNNAIVVSDYQEDIVVKVLKKQVKKYQIKSLLIGGIYYKIENNKINTNIINKNYSSTNNLFKEINLHNISLQGEHQKNNASLAIMALSQLENINLNATKINNALLKTRWSGRQQHVKSIYNVKLQKDDVILLDGAHNTAGLQSLLGTINKYKNEGYKIYFMFSLLKKKKLVEFLKELQSTETIIIPLQQQDQESHTVEEIVEVCNKLQIHVLNTTNIEETRYNITSKLELISQQPNKKLIIIGGSLYLIGKILKDNNINIS